MKNFNNRLKRIQEEGISISVLDIIKEAWNIYTKITLTAGFTIFFLALILGLIASGIVTYLSFTPEELMELKEFNPIKLPLNGLIIYTVIMSVITGIGSGISAGLIKMAADVNTGKAIVWTTIFRYFKDKCFINLFIAHFTITLFFTAITLFLQINNLQYVALAINWIINSITILITPLIIFGRLSAFSAIYNSVNIINTQPFHVIGLLLLSAGFSSIGVLFFFVGFFFTIPFVYCVYFVLYDKTVGYYTEDNNSDENVEKLDHYEK